MYGEAPCLRRAPAPTGAPPRATCCSSRRSPSEATPRWSWPACRHPCRIVYRTCRGNSFQSRSKSGRDRRRASRRYPPRSWLWPLRRFPLLAAGLRHPACPLGVSAGGSGPRRRRRAYRAQGCATGGPSSQQPHARRGPAHAASRWCPCLAGRGGTSRSGRVTPYEGGGSPRTRLRRQRQNQVIYIYTYMHTCIHINICICMYIYNVYLQTYIHIHTYIHGGVSREEATR